MAESATCSEIKTGQDGKQYPAQREQALIRLSGAAFDLFAPDPRLLHVEDVAGPLSRLCRWGGRGRRFLSVAEHSILVADVVRRQPDLRSPPLSAVEQELVALLHDGAEALMGADLVTPLKYSQPLAAYREIEARVQAAVFERYRLPATPPPGIKAADRAVAAAEALVLFGSFEAAGLPPDVTPAAVRVRCWSPRTAEARFLERARKLAHARLCEMRRAELARLRAPQIGA